MLSGLCGRLTCLMPQWQWSWGGDGVFAGRGVWNPLINVTCLWSKENTQMTSESGGALGERGAAPHPGKLGLGVWLQTFVIAHIVRKTKISRGSALMSITTSFCLLLTPAIKPVHPTRSSFFFMRQPFRLQLEGGWLPNRRRAAVNVVFQAEYWFERICAFYQNETGSMWKNTPARGFF